MKSNFGKRTLCIIISFLLAMISTAFPVMAEEPAAVQDEKTHTIEARTYPYLRAFDDEEEVIEDEMTLYFIDNNEIPYIELAQYMSFLSSLLADMEVGDVTYEISETEDHVFMVSRSDNNSFMFVNTVNDTMTFTDFNLFTQVPGTSALVSILDLPEPEPFDLSILSDIDWSDISFDDNETAAGADVPDEPESSLPEEETAADADVFTSMFGMSENSNELFRIKHRSINRSGGIINLNLSEYLIDMVDDNGKCYIPMQTLNDLLLSHYYMQYVFNGETVIGAGYGCSLLQKMYEAQPCQMSIELAVFNYTELLLLLDCFYGLKPEHNINNFIEMLTSDTSLAYDMMNTDPRKFDDAIRILTGMYMDDLHSGFQMSSWRSGEEDFLSILLSLGNMGPSNLAMSKADETFSEARKAVYREWVPGYEEIDDTAFITFDTFTTERDDPSGYYNYFFGAPADTIELIIYAHRQITREVSPVKNVVVDLSNNGGGSAAAAVFVISWMLGQATIALRDTFTGAESIIDYQADVNLDNQFDSATDSLIGGGYRVYCMTSPKSFSCGNLVPAACKASRQVTLIGQASSGGSCVVLPCTTASGTIFQISGNKQLSIVKNGSFYNIDSGIQPDVELTKPESFYDRPALVEYLHELK